MLWYVKKEHINELSNVRDAWGALDTMNQMVEEKKAVTPAPLSSGKTTLGREFNVQMLNDDAYVAVSLSLEQGLQIGRLGGKQC